MPQLFLSRAEEGGLDKGLSLHSHMDGGRQPITVYKVPNNVFIRC